MPCYRPLRGFKGVNGGISWTPSQSFVDVPMTVPCGQCIGCRLERARQWSVRLMHEASLHDDNCFLTLTYDQEHLPKDGSLDRRHFQLFMKRLRRKLEPKRVSYFHCGEYGDKTGRPHYHCLLFGWDPPDRRFRGRGARGDPIFTSRALDAVWALGNVYVGSVTRQSAGYVARYCLKKVTGDIADDHYRRYDDQGVVYWIAPEYATMSNRPGIGKGWFERFACDVVTLDGVITEGARGRSPRYYDKLRGKVAMKVVKRKRVVKMLQHAADLTGERLAVREEVCKARTKQLKRDLE